MMMRPLAWRDAPRWLAWPGARRSLPWLVLIAGLLAALGAVIAWSTCSCGKLTPEGEGARVFAGLAFVIGGAAALTQPGNLRTGLLMAAVGLTWFLDDLGWIYVSLPYTISRFGTSLFEPLLAHLAVGFPSGRLRTRLDRGVIGLAYGLWFVTSLATLVFWDPQDAGCGGCPPNLLMIHRDPGLHELAETTSTLLSLGMTAVLLALVIRHYSSASAAGRRAFAPILWASGPLAAAVILYSAIGRAFVPPLAPIALAALPLAFLIGLLRIRLDRAEVGKLVVELGAAPHPGRLRDALARTLHDPTLQVAYWLREREVFVDAAGVPIELPRASSRRVVTRLERAGEPIAALVHDPALQDDPELIEATAAAARLAIDNERLQAEIRAQLHEVRASRARIVQAADAERRRIERDLHDGSQQRLVTLSMALTLARARLAQAPNRELESLLTEAAGEVQLALGELRELARGIHPAILTEAGLGPALESLAQRSGLPVRIALTPIERLPAPIEAAAYFVVAEALANVAKYASATSVTISASVQDQVLCVEVVDNGRGGADPARGSGLLGLADRVGALDGRFEVTSQPGLGTCVHAELPW